MERRSLFYPLAQEGLTTLRIQYDWKTDHVFLQASKDWDEDFDGHAITMIFMWRVLRRGLRVSSTIKRRERCL